MSLLACDPQACGRGAGSNQAGVHNAAARRRLTISRT